MKTLIYNKKYQFLTLLLLVFAVWFTYLPQSTGNLYKEIVSNCAFETPGHWRAGPYPTAIPWCETYKKQKYLDLLDHLKMASTALPDHGILTAPEFGSDVRVLYIASLGVSMFNPEIESYEPEVIVCEEDYGNGPVQSFRPKQATIRFVNAQYRADSITLDGELGCLVQSAIESFVGLQPVYVTSIN